MIQLYFEIKPLAKQSFRFTQSGRKYLDSDVVDYKNIIRFLARQQIPKDYKLLTEAVHVEALFCYKRPNSFKKAQKTAIDELGYIYWKPTKPDIDNLQKGTLDALNGIIWSDDAVVSEVTARKCWSDKNEIMIRITELPQDWRYQKDW